MESNNNSATALCQCGRELGPRAHCPECGTMKCYALIRKKDLVTRPNGDTVELRVWRCTRCGRKFNDDDWQLRCAAPPEARRGRKRQIQPFNDGKPLQVEDMMNDPDVRRVLQKWQKWEPAGQQAEPRKTPQQLFEEAKLERVLEEAKMRRASEAILGIRPKQEDNQ